MSKTPGDRLNDALSGRYRIERGIGEGGMATVYLAHDLKHERKVALKVLKPELAAVVGGERFLTEIKTTANLQHPHILPLYDSGEAGSFLYYVMPYVEGETLRDRIDRQKQLPVDEAVRIAVAVANALDYAHRHNVVHRDIKPGNILMQDGQPVVGDFGIALAVGSAGGARLTETGLSVGTPYYMSPEQATGDVGVGPASDIYALSAVLYEMLTGEPPYTGTTAQAVLGRIIQGGSVSAREVRRSVPENVDAAIRKGLEKLPADRFASAQQLARAVQDPAFRHGDDRSSAAAAGAGPWKWVAAAAGIVALALGTALALRMSEPEPVRPVERFAMPFLPEDQITYTDNAGYELSPDGSMLVYRHDVDGTQVLVTRRWDELGATPIRDTQGASRPSVSPDGNELAYQQGGDIKVLAFAGGPVRTLGPGSEPLWGRDGWIYAIADSGIVRMPPTGGAVETLTSVEEGIDVHVPFDVLPGGDGLLYFSVASDGSTFEVRGLDISSGESRSIVPGLAPRYLPTGHLVYGQEGVMMAARFDPGSMELLGTPVAVMDGLTYFSIADDGKLFYTTGSAFGTSVDQTIQLIWVTRAGATTPVDPGWTFTRGGPDTWWSISPDGTRLAVRERTADGNDIWIKQLPDGPRSRLTFGDSEERNAIWGPEPGDVTFLSDRDGNLDVWAQRADGTGEPRLILDFPEDIATAEWSPDRQFLVFRTAGPRGVEANRDIYLFRPGVDTSATPLLADPGYDEMYPEISPDGRWIAYQTTETDRHEVYVRPFPDVGTGRWQVSIDGGRGPQWSHSGDEIFFQGPNRQMMVVDVDTSEGFRAGTPRMLFESEDDWIDGDILGNIYAVAPDDRRFVMGRQVTTDDGDEDEPTAILVNNFFSELQARVGGN